MLFFFRKLIEAMLMPLGLFGILVLLGVWLRRHWLIFAAVIMLFFLSTTFGSRMLLTPLEHTYPSRPVSDAPMADAIVVLSGDILRGVSPSGVQWGDNANRYFTGVALARADRARYLVLSAGTPPTAHSVDQGVLLRRLSVENGIPDNRILITRHALTTEDEARAVSGMPGIHSILLVTSAFHMPRAAMLFRARKFEVFPFPTDNRIIGPEFGRLAMLPEPSNLRESELALREYYGLVVYKTLFLLHPGGL